MANELSSTKQELSVTIHNLSVTSSELSSTEQDLSMTKQQLYTAEPDLGVAKQDLSATKQDLSSTKQDLSATKQEPTITKHGLNEAKTSLKGQGSTFERWGRTACPNNTELVYKDPISRKQITAADFICVAGNPTWRYFDSSNNRAAGRLRGVEYQFAHHNYLDGGTRFFGQNLHDHGAPCCVCRSNLPSTIMIPGRNLCYPGWTQQYAGYLVSGYPDEQSATNYACLDPKPETELGDIRNVDGKLMFTVEAECGSLKCLPYVEGREITCVVCSK